MQTKDKTQAISKKDIELAHSQLNSSLINLQGKFVTQRQVN